MTQWSTFRFSTCKNYNIGETIAAVPVLDVLIVGILAVNEKTISVDKTSLLRRISL